MTLTNKDKLMLVVLAIVIFVAIFVVYGILPANDELKAIKADVTEKRAEVEALNDRFNKIDTETIEKNIDKILDTYYLNNQKVLDDEKGIIQVNREITALMYNNGLREYSTLGWKVATNTDVFSYDGNNVSYTILYVDCSTSFSFTNFDNLYTFIDEVEKNPSMYLQNMNISIEEVADADGNVSDKLSGSLTLRYLMQADMDASGIPQPMPKCSNVTYSNNSISFNAMEGAVEYEICSVILDDEGEVCGINSVLNTYRPTANTGMLTVEVKGLQSGVNHIIVRAVGDRSQNMFKSLLTDADIIPITVQ